MIFLIPAIIILILFYRLYYKQRRPIAGGILITVLLALFLLGLCGYALISPLSPVIWVILGIVALVFLMGPVLLLFSSIALMINGQRMVSREGTRVSNLLPLFLGLIMLAALLLFYTLPFFMNVNPVIPLIYSMLAIVVLFFGFLFISFANASALYYFNKPSYDEDFILILGCRVIDGKVTPLLAKRLDRAIAFYEKQIEMTGKKAKFVVSGGKGTDESVSEASVMKDYLLSKGYNESDILVEDHSRDTRENMLFSKAIIDRLKPNARGVFITSSFHVLRSSLYARDAGLDFTGIPAKTAFYYFPNAFLREFIGVLSMNRQTYAIVFAALVLCTMVPQLVFLNMGLL